MWTFIIVGGSNLDFLQKNNLYKYFPTGCHPFLNQSLLETPKWEVKPTGNPTLGGLEKFLCAWAGLHTRVLVGLFAVRPCDPAPATAFTRSPPHWSWRRASPASSNWEGSE